MMNPIHFLVDDYFSRGEARRAASEERVRLDHETGYDHEMKWDLAGERYTVSRKPFTPPNEAWDCDENRPVRKSPDWKKTPTINVPLDRLIIDAQNLEMLQWLGASTLPHDPAQFVKDLQVALDHQYGRGHFWAYRHGHHVAVQCRYPVEKK